MEENIMDMEMIQPKVDLIQENDPYKKIELVGRTCYKSEDKITQDSSKKFVQGLIKRNHTAMLEHATVLFQLDPSYESYVSVLRQCKYLNVTCTEVSRPDGKKYLRILVSGNIRAINESDVFVLLQTMYENSVYRDLVYNKQFIDTYADQVEGQTSFYNAKIVDINSLDHLSEEEILNHCYMTLRFTCDRGVSHEIVRHREMSFGQESTRYVNYRNSDMKFITPSYFSEIPEEAQIEIIRQFCSAKNSYGRLIDMGLSPQQARCVLPTDVKTEICVTGNYRKWNHFFDLRYFAKTGSPHPDMKKVASIAYQIYEFQRKFI